ncbi:MAG TPA: glycosyl hydrolase [Chromatiales bacterium]|nr:glycosyl hydrolase [Chromatiales bacterium]
MKKARILALYLPQFHPIPENDRWWGPGFTEWTNVVRSKPRFPGHDQPQLPGELGFYDLRLAETRAAQAELALTHGIDGFCYYHYWFHGKRLLHRPLDDMLAAGTPDMPFCLCWANENWTRAWDGMENEVLIAQEYDAADDLAHIRWLQRVFADPRYIRIKGRPLFLVYRPDKLPEPAATLERWRLFSQEQGIEAPYVCAVTSGLTDMDEPTLLAQGYDAIMGFHPNRKDFPPADTWQGRIIQVARKYLPSWLYQRLKSHAPVMQRVSYAKYVEGQARRPWPKAWHKWPCVFPSWDNSARRTSPTIVQNESPEAFAAWLKHAIECVDDYPEDERLVFINAWNEWAEGCHLEPDMKHGRAMLEAVRGVVQGKASHR